MIVSRVGRHPPGGHETIAILNEFLTLNYPLDLGLGVGTGLGLGVGALV